MSKRTDTIRSLFTAAPEIKAAPDTRGLSSDNQQDPAQAPPRERRSAGAVNSIRSTFSDIEQENAALRAEVAGGERILDIDTSLIAPSPFPDRFAQDDDVGFANLVESIAARGQEVPVLLRPHPAEPGRYQTAYGHRRIRALRQLGRPVRAVVRALSDDDLAAAQGIENAARADLSFIERAVFALRLEDAGRGRVVVQQALSVDKAEASKLIAVARSVPGEIITAIGRAPKSGRPRWQALAQVLQQEDALRRARDAMAVPAFTGLDSDARFRAVLAAAQRAPIATSVDRPARMLVRSAEGEVIAKVTDGQGVSQITIDRMDNAGFADFVVRELAGLHQQFRRGQLKA